MNTHPIIQTDAAFAACTCASVEDGIKTDAQLIPPRPSAAAAFPIELLRHRVGANLGSRGLTSQCSSVVLHGPWVKRATGFFPLESIGSAPEALGAFFSQFKRPRPAARQRRCSGRPRFVHDGGACRCAKSFTGKSRLCSSTRSTTRGTALCVSLGIPIGPHHPGAGVLRF